MNRGHCKNYWWWKEYYPGFGKCYMHKSNTEQYTITEENRYCPDFSSRKKEKDSLDDFIRKVKK